MNLGDGGDAVGISGSTLSLSSTGVGNDITINSADQIVLSDFITDANAVLYTDTSGNLTRVVETGTGGYCLLSGAGTTGVPVWSPCPVGATTYWDLNQGALAPSYSTLDLLIGGSATSSAKFAVTNVAGSRGTQVATLSGSLVLDTAGSLTTTNNQTLTLGGGATGNLVLGGFGTGILHSDINGVLSSSAVELGGSDVTGTLGVGNGGTGVNTFGGTNTLLYTTAADSLASLATANNGALITDGTGVPSFSTAGANQILRSNGGGTLAFGSIDLSQSNSVGSSILGVANGGTGADLSSSNAQGSVPFFSSGGVLTSLAPGAAGYVLTTNDTGADPTWVDASSLGTNYLQRNLGTIAPVNITDDLLLGGIATSSARFAFINNIGAGTPTASISANSGNNALYITGRRYISYYEQPNSNNWRK